MKDLWERFKIWWVASRHPYEAEHDRLIELHEQNNAREKEWIEACRRQERQELRDRFAMAALTGILMVGDRALPRPIVAAEWSYEYADAMMKARGDGHEPKGEQR